MNLKQLSVNELIQLPLKDSSKQFVRVYTDHSYYYKLWTIEYSDPHYYIDGLDPIWVGYDKLAALELGLINSTISSAFCDLIYDADRVCGYVTKAGSTNISQVDQISFLKKLAEFSISIGYTFTDIDSNLIKLDGEISLIDYEDVPISIESLKKLNKTEMNFIENLVFDINYSNPGKRTFKYENISSMYLKILNLLISRE
jgi:hypothetical protein